MPQLNYKVFYVKDMSELEESTQEKLINEAFYKIY